VRVTEPAQRAVLHAKQEAGRLGHDRVGTEDLLLGLAREGEGVAARVLEELGGGLLELREAVVARYAAGGPADPGVFAAVGGPTGADLPGDLVRLVGPALGLAGQATRSSHSASRAVSSPTCSWGRAWPAPSSTAKVARG
jgi:hypothetical protein